MVPIALAPSPRVAATAEIYAELTLLPGSIGGCLQQNKDELLMEVDHHGYISGYNSNRKRTVGI